MNLHPTATTAVLAAALLLSGCTSAPLPLPLASPPSAASAAASTATPVTPADVATALARLPTGALLLLGEQHDADAHQALEQATVALLAQQGRLAALVLEMAERGSHTRGLARDASEQQVQARLRWNDAGWPWTRYGPVVMAAVRAGVLVLGGNQPRADMRTSMGDATLDQRLAPEALARQHQAIADGHCGLLPASQLGPMARIQIARDIAMAQTLTEAMVSATEGQRVVLVAGARHVLRDLGVPVHLRPDVAARAQVVVMHSGAHGSDSGAGADRVWLTPATPPKDHCAELRQRWAR